MRISALEGCRVALWGWGRESRAAYRAFRAAFPKQSLTLFCTIAEATEVQALTDPVLSIETEVSVPRLAAFDVVIKSPGISPYSPLAVAATAAGAHFIGGTQLWFAAHADTDGVVPGAVCVTGTKGKSTTTALLAHLLRAAGHCTALTGNIGLPLLELLTPQPAPEYWAIELSSYQTADVAGSGARPALALVLNVFPEHLDWHGGEQRYINDKLSLVTVARPLIALLNAADPRLASLVLPQSDLRWFNRRDGWHVRGQVVYRGEQAVLDTALIPLPGAHNGSNVCAVLATLEALGLNAVALAPAACNFRPLPNRLQFLGERDGILWVNDSISTTPHATLAALDCFLGRRRVAVLVGGYDRGVNWECFAARITRKVPLDIVTMGANGPHIKALLAPLAAGRFGLHAAVDLPHAVALARTALGAQGGVLLLSPGAPSFGAYQDYVERGRHFAILAGFDPEVISSISGLGIA